MRLNYKLQRVCGTYYSGPGCPVTPNIVFANDETNDIVISPALNRLQYLDVRESKINTMPFESRSNIAVVGINRENILMVVDVDNYYQIVKWPSGVVLARGKFKRKVKSIQWKNCGNIVSVSEDSSMSTWKLFPFEETCLVKLKSYGGFCGSIVSVCWSEKGNEILVTSEDGTARLFKENKETVTLISHKAGLLAGYFGGSNQLYTVACDAAVFVWSINSEGDYVPEKHFAFQSGATVCSCAFHESSALLSLGYTNGLFCLYELPSMAAIHNLSLSKAAVRAMAFNSTGSSIAMGVASNSTQSLLLWEWSSETFLFKQSSHTYSITTFAFSPSAAVICTGGEDGKVKLWKTFHGICYVTLPVTHTAPVTAIVFSSNEKVVLSASLDGTIRAHDLLRYRNFRTFAPPMAVQISVLACNGSSSVIAAGSKTDPYHVFLWNMQNGQLLDTLSAHTAPISDVHFSSSLLISSSWDGKINLWDYTSSSRKVDTFDMAKDIICSALRPDGKQMVVATLNAFLTVWDLERARILHEIDGQRDIAGNRKYNDKNMSKSNVFSSRYFNSISYSADGSCILAGGNSNFICMYHLSNQVLLKKFVITSNRSLDGVFDYYSKSQDFDPIDPLQDRLLPGARRRDDGTRTSRPEAITTTVAFSSTSREWATVSSEGLHVYSIDDEMIFDPISLTQSITTDNILQQLQNEEYGIALRLSLQLNEYSFILKVLENTPFSSIANVVQSLKQLQNKEYGIRLLFVFSKILDTTPHIEFYIQWILLFLQTHGIYLQKYRSKYMQAFRALYKSLTMRCDDINTIWEQNQFLLAFIDEVGHLNIDSSTSNSK